MSLKKQPESLSGCLVMKYFNLEDKTPDANFQIDSVGNKMTWVHLIMFKQSYKKSMSTFNMTTKHLYPVYPHGNTGYTEYSV